MRTVSRGGAERQYGGHLKLRKTATSHDVIGVKRVTVFAKGNVDIYDSLHSCRIAGKVCWNGINEVIRARYEGLSVRLQHETCTRSDALLAADGTVPADLRDRPLTLGAYPLASQFSDAIFRTNADAIILSLQSDLTNGLERHAQSGFLFHPGDYADWRASDRDWLRETFIRLETLEPRDSMANFERIVSRIRLNSPAPILIFNLAPTVPGERIHCFQGFEDSLSVRIQRFNLGLIELSQKTGVSIVDVARVVARAGADHVSLDFMHFTPDGYRLIAEEVVRVLDDLGVLSSDGET